MGRDSAVRWRLAVPPEVETEYAGTRLGHYYRRADVVLATHRTARERFLSLYRADIGELQVPVPAYVGVASLGADLVLPDDHPPMLANQGRVLPDERSVLELTPADPETSSWLQYYLEVHCELRCLSGLDVAMAAGQEGPITSAVLLRGSAFYQDLLDSPKVAHHLLSVVTQTYVDFVKFVRRCNGQPERGPVGIADDMAGTISPAMWPEFVIPYWTRIYQALGSGHRSLHSELLRPAHLALLLQLELDSLDPGNDQYLTVEDLVANLGATTFWWNLFTVRDMLNGTAESIRELYAASVRAGARHIMTELCRGTPPDNIRAFVQAAREHE